MMARVALAVILGAWGVMLLVLRFHHVRLRRPSATRRSSSRAGLLLQALAYGLVFIRPRGATLFAAGWPVTVATLAPIAAVMSVAGAAIVLWSQRTLGVQWSLTARLIDGHRLIVSGPYAYVRHPIYSAMILMLLSTGFALTTPVIVGVSLALDVVGTMIRIRAEEALMEDAFGADWDRYRRRIPALIPFSRLRRL